MKKSSYFNVHSINFLFALIIGFSGDYALAGSDTELRCGWFENPSPGNASITDRDGEWAISIQGEYEAKGEWPKFKKSEWVQQE